MYRCDGNDYDLATGRWFGDTFGNTVEDDEFENLQDTEEYSAELKKFLDEVLG